MEYTFEGLDPFETYEITVRTKNFLEGAPADKLVGPPATIKEMTKGVGKIHLIFLIKSLI